MSEKKPLQIFPKETPEPVDFNEYIKGEEVLSGIGLREMAAKFLFYAYGGLLVATMAIFFLHGFKLGGFQLEKELLQWLGAATIGEIGGLAAIVYGALFKKQTPE